MFRRNLLYSAVVLLVGVSILPLLGCSHKSDENVQLSRNEDGKLDARMVPDPMASPGELMCTPLHIAVSLMDISEVRRLTAAGFDPNQMDSVGKTPLMWLIGRIDSSPTNDAKRTTIAEILVDAGADLDVQSKTNGDTALHLASRFGQVAIVELLLMRGANINSVNNQRNTPLHTACETIGRESVRSIPILLKHHASLDAKNRDGNTPLEAAKKAGRKDAEELIRETTHESQIN